MILRLGILGRWSEHFLEDHLSHNVTVRFSKHSSNLNPRFYFSTIHNLKNYQTQSKSPNKNGMVENKILSTPHKNLLVAQDLPWISRLEWNRFRESLPNQSTPIRFSSKKAKRHKHTFCIFQQTNQSNTMRSLLWTGVYILLVVELCFTAILVLPIPNKFRNKIVLSVSKLDLKQKLQPLFLGIFIALVVALLDTSVFLSNIYSQKQEDYPLHSEHHRHDYHNNSIDRHLLKEREYKAGRNLYLAAFALTLLFVIGRITELLQEHAELAGKIENLQLAAEITASSEKQKEGNTTLGDDDVPTEGIEMKPIAKIKRV